MPTDVEWERVLRKLTEQTEAGEVSWRQATEVKRDNLVGTAYAAVAKNRNVCVYEFRYKEYLGSGAGDDDWEWENEVAVEFISGIDDQVEYQWPAVHGRWELLDKVRCVVSGAADFVKDFLKEQ